MDLCGTDLLKENILLGENKLEYFEKKKHVSKKQFRDNYIQECWVVCFMNL